MNQGIILHSVGDAVHCLRNRLHENNLLFSTHSTVDIFLREFHGLECRCLSAFFDMEEIKEAKEISSERVEHILKGIDEKSAASINEQLDLKINYFWPLYSYLGKYHYSGYMFFLMAIKKIRKEFNLSKIKAYNYVFNNLIAVDTDLKAISANLFGADEMEIIDCGADKNHSVSDNYQYWTSQIKYSLFLPRKVVDKLLGIMKHKIYKKKLDKKKTTLAILGYLYSYKSIINLLNDYNLIIIDNDGGLESIYDNQLSHHSELVTDIAFDFKDANISALGEVDKIFFQDVIQNFSRKINSYFKVIKVLAAIDEKFPLSLAIWGSPPDSGPRALLNEYLSSRGKTVLGAQHGAIYGDSLEPWHFDSDFRRCDYYVSFGFTHEDLRRLYPDKEVETNILPLGYGEPKSSRKNKKEVDILFPITNSISIFEGGMIRLPPDRLTERQIVLLEYLNSLERLKVHIKPFKLSNYNNCSVLPTLRRLKNLRIIDYLTLLEYLENYSPQAVLIEFSSQPLYEVLHLDTEIFLMNDPLHPFDPSALVELQKRVHYAEDNQEMMAMLDRYWKGDLEKKRDNTFYHHYVYKEKTEENLLCVIRQLAGGQGIDL
jgi:hypothetical protein